MLAVLITEINIPQLAAILILRHHTELTAALAFLRHIPW
jgi:hypothetical protein